VWANDWSHWLKDGAGLPELSLRGPTYSLYSLAVQEAVNGAGVLMGHESLIAPLLKAGRLVAPFKRPVATGLALSLEMRQPVRDPLARFVSALKGA
jgi:LysR family glycine cleavage system transcriptional activator